MALNDTIYCEMCELPCMASANGTKCERCAHVLGNTVDLEQLRAEILKYKRQVRLGVLAVASMLVLNWFILGGIGGVLMLAPLGWAVWGYREMRHRQAYLARAQTSNI